MITYTAINENKTKSVVLIGLFLILVIGLGFVFSQAYGDPGILVLATAFSLVSALFSYYFSDSITLALSGAREIDRKSNPELFRLVENLTIAAGLPLPRIYVVDDSAPNAFATGRDPKHAVVCVTTGILERLEKAELEGVIAHELSHIGNYDIRVMTLVVVLVGTLTLLADWMLRFSFFGGRRKSNNDGGASTLFFVLGIILAILSPIIATLIKLAVSRQREYLADASGALLTRYPEGLARALEKISSNTKPLEHASNATAHLYIVNPFTGQDTRQWLTNLFNTHPPIEERVKRLREMNL